MVLVYFMGIDGSGKTSHASASVEWLKKKNVKATTIHFYKNPMVKFFSTIKRIIKPSSRNYVYVDSNRSVYSKHLRRNVPAWVGKYDGSITLSRIRPYMTLIDNLIYAFLLIMLRNLQGYDIIICDRFLYDYFLRYKLLGYPTWGLEKFYLKLIPKLGICFDVSPEETSTKRRDLEPVPISYYVNARRILLRIARMRGFPMLDTTNEPFEKVQKQVNQYFIEMLGDGQN